MNKFINMNELVFISSTNKLCKFFPLRLFYFPFRSKSDDRERTKNQFQIEIKSSVSIKRLSNGNIVGITA